MDAVDLLDPLGYSHHALEHVSGEYVLADQRNEERLIAAEDNSHMLIELLSLVLLGYEPIDGGVEVEVDLTGPEIDDAGKREDRDRYRHQQDEPTAACDETGERVQELRLL